MRPTRLLPLVLGALACAHAATWLGAGPHDDDFIFYRYARALLETGELALAPAGPAEGFTSPLWLGWITAGLGLGASPVVWSLAASVLSVGVAAWAVASAWALRDGSEGAPSGSGALARIPVPGLLCAASPALAFHGVVGLGTTAMAAAVALAFRSHLVAVRSGERAVWTGVWLAVACGLRQEAVLLVVPALLVEGWRGGRRALVPFALPLAVLAGWTLFRLVTFESLLPVTYRVKKLPFLADLEYGLRYLARGTGQAGVGLGLLAGWVFALRRSPDLPGADGESQREPGDSRGRRSRPVELAWLAGVTLHAAYVVQVGGDYMELARFFVPTLPLLAWFGCRGTAVLTGRDPLAPVGATALAVLALQWPQVVVRPQAMGEHAFFEERWALLGSALREAFPPDTTVALSPVGAFGWTSRLPIVDLLGRTHDGLVDVAPDLEIAMKGHHRHDGEWALAQEPDVLLLANGVVQPGGGVSINPWEWDLFQHPARVRDYRAWIVPVEGSYPVLLHLREGVPVPPGARRAP